MVSNKYWIRVLDPIESLMSPELALLAKPILSYKAVFYKPGVFKQTRKEYDKSTIISKTKEGSVFYTGFIPRILKMLEQNNLPVRVDNEFKNPILLSGKDLPNDTKFRSFQQDLINKALENVRGVLKAPTGTGKTFLGLSLINSIQFSDGGVLWLCHTKDLMKQTAKEAEKFFGKINIGLIGDGICETNKFLTVATRQSFIKLVHDLGSRYEMVIIDEVHHISSFSGTYAQILENVFAPIRIGLTATIHTELEPLLAMEAFIGPVIGEFTINEGREQGYMANPKICISKLPKNYSVKELRKYVDVYEAGVVRNLERNQQITNLIIGHELEGKSCLVIVNKIAHGELLENLCKHRGIDAVFVCGSTDSDTRVLVKESLNDKHIKCVICTAIWKEGVNIPELDVIINAAGGKSEITTLQSIGRGLRRTKDKSELIIHDFFDPSHNYLISHFGERISLYMDMGWL